MIPSFLVLELLPDRLEDIEHLADVAVLGHKQAGQPASLVGESHVHHGLQSNLDLGIRVRGRSRSCCWGGRSWCWSRIRSRCWRGSSCCSYSFLLLWELWVQIALRISIDDIGQLLGGLVFIFQHGPFLVIVSWRSRSSGPVGGFLLLDRSLLLTNNFDKLLLLRS